MNPELWKEPWQSWHWRTAPWPAPWSREACQSASAPATKKSSSQFTLIWSKKIGSTDHNVWDEESTATILISSVRETPDVAQANLDLLSKIREGGALPKITKEVCVLQSHKYQDQLWPTWWYKRGKTYRHGDTGEEKLYGVAPLLPLLLLHLLHLANLQPLLKIVILLLVLSSQLFHGDRVHFMFVSLNFEEKGVRSCCKFSRAAITQKKV